MPYDLYGEDAEAGGWLASVRARMRDEATQRAQRPNWGETRWEGPEGYKYIPLPAYDSNIGELFARAVTQGPLAIGSRPGARAGNDAVWANRIERTAPESDPGITGGYVRVRGIDPFPGLNSSSGLAQRHPDSIRPAVDPAPYYPARQDRPVPANNNRYLAAHDRPQGQQQPMAPEVARARIAEIEQIRRDKVWSGEWTMRSPQFQALGDEISQLMIHLHAPAGPAPRPSLSVIPGGKTD